MTAHLIRLLGQFIKAMLLLLAVPAALVLIAIIALGALAWQP